jgi:hypothetical protein
MSLLRRRAPIALIVAAWLAWSAAPAGHDVPSDVRIQLFLKPEGGSLHLLVRAPLASMNDIAWPLNGVFLDLGGQELSTALNEGARTWIAERIDVFEAARLLDAPVLRGVRVSLPSDRSFDSFETARASISGPPLGVTVQLPGNQAMVDAHLEYVIRSNGSDLSINPRYRLLGLKALTVLRFTNADGVERVLEFHDDPGLVRLDPSGWQAARLFVVEGFRHILSGADHLLFLFCLVIPFRRLGQLVLVVTAFTVAHSITLFASAFGMAPDAGWFPPLVETLIAISIVYMALENVVAPGLGRRWIIAFGFGLIHGFGFSFALRDTLQLAGSHVVTSLLAFNVGVELGQIAVLAVLLPALALLFRFVVAERLGTILLSALVAHTAWHWMIDRGKVLALYPVAWPEFDLAFFVGLTRWLMVLVAMAAMWWLVGLFTRRDRPDKDTTEA